jgi:DnaJ-class molecular chaperone
MPTKKDYYEILGIPKNATDKQIKAAYRKLARKYHPDHNPGNKGAEDKFKEVAEASAVLSDPEKRAKYDQRGHEAFGPEFDPFAGTGFDFRNMGAIDINDLFEMLGGGGRARSGRTRATRGQDLETEIRLPFLDAVMGSTFELNLPRRGPGGTRTEERVKVRIPPGIDEGGRVRLPGKGDAGANGGPAGDMYLVVRVEPHPMVRREGRDLYVDVPVTISRAALGGTIVVPTPDGTSTISLPAGTRSGQRMRLRGKGIPATSAAPAGDLFAVIQIVPPKSLDARSRQLLEELDKLHPAP